jgi:hypothetical protein
MNTEKVTKMIIAVIILLNFAGKRNQKLSRRGVSGKQFLNENS